MSTHLHTYFVGWPIGVYTHWDGQDRAQEIIQFVHDNLAYYADDMDLVPSIIAKLDNGEPGNTSLFTQPMDTGYGEYHSVRLIVDTDNDRFHLSVSGCDYVGRFTDDMALVCNWLAMDWLVREELPPIDIAEWLENF